jgi:hypothetical protein
MSSKPARFWILTIPHGDWEPVLYDGVAYAKGQAELGAGGYEHWQLIVILSKPQRLSWLKSRFPRSAHAEPTRSVAAEGYVWKEDTRIADTGFELGTRPFQRNNAKHWSGVWESAVGGRMLEIPSPVRVCHYRTLRCIGADYARPMAMEREVKVYWGRTGMGKSRLAWEECGLDSYPKDPRTKVNIFRLML